MLRLRAGCESCTQFGAWLTIHLQDFMSLLLNRTSLWNRIEVAGFIARHISQSILSFAHDRLVTGSRDGTVRVRSRVFAVHTIAACSTNRYLFRGVPERVLGFSE